MLNKVWVLQKYWPIMNGLENWTTLVYFKFCPPPAPPPSAEVPITHCSAVKEERQTRNSIVFFLPVCLSLSFFLSSWQLGVPAGTDNWNTCPFLEEDHGWWSLTYGFCLLMCISDLPPRNNKSFFTEKPSASPLFLLLVLLLVFFTCMSSASSTNWHWI